MAKKYKLSDDCPVQTIMVRSEDGKMFVPKEVKGICPFGPQTGITTDETLTDTLAEFVIGNRKELAKYIVSADEEPKEPKGKK